MYVEFRYSDSCLYKTRIMNPPDTGFHSSGGQQFFYLNFHVVKCYQVLLYRNAKFGCRLYTSCSTRVVFASLTLQGPRQDQLNEIPSFTIQGPFDLTKAYSYNDLSPYQHNPCIAILH
jgi:hypothetical protein